MGNKDEAQWVLERLTKTLERELEEMRREEEEGRGDWAPGGRMEGTGPMFGDREGKGQKDEKGEFDVGEDEGPNIDGSTVKQERKNGEEVEGEMKRSD